MKQIRIKISPPEGRLWPGDCGLKQCDVSYAVDASRDVYQATVNKKNLFRRDILHFFASAFRAGSYRDIKSFT